MSEEEVTTLEAQLADAGTTGKTAPADRQKKAPTPAAGQEISPAAAEVQRDEAPDRPPEADPPQAENLPDGAAAPEIASAPESPVTPEDIPEDKLEDIPEEFTLGQENKDESENGKHGK
jgi:hypothetical protein